MKQKVRSLADRALSKLAPKAGHRLRERLGRRAQTRGTDRSEGPLRPRVEALEHEVQELRRLNRRLSDALDVMTELLVPAMDRDDAKVKAALDRLDKPA
jgi:hypothetical protein